MPPPPPSTTACALGTFSYYNLSAQAWNCGACQANCDICSGTYVSVNSVISYCTSCSSGYYFSFDFTTFESTCALLPQGCLSSQYSAVSDYISGTLACFDCPLHCTACTQSDVYDPFTLQCTDCDTNSTFEFTTQYGYCDIAYDGEAALLTA